MKLLITGAGGMVGRAVCQMFNGRGYSVRAVTRAARHDVAGLETANIGDITAQTNWQAALTDIDCVVHLAARVHVMRDDATDPLAEFRRVNVQGTLNLARQAAAAGTSRFVFISSVKVNGESTPPGQPFTDTDVPNPQDAYAQSKHEAEQGLLQIAAETGMALVIIRPPLVYGQGVKANFAALLRAVQRGWPLPLGAVHNRRSLVALDNLADFIVTCAVHPRAAGQMFLVSDGQDVSTSELIRAMARAAGRPARLLPFPVWLLLVVSWFLGKREVVGRLCGNLQLDISKARNMLGWTPPVTLAEGLQSAVDGTVNHSVQRLIDKG